MLTQARKRHRRQLDARVEVERFGQINDVERGTLDLAACQQLLVWTALRQRREQGDGPAAVGDLDRLAGLDSAQQLAGPLPQRTPTEVIVLTVAQAVGVMGRRSTRAGFK